MARVLLDVNIIASSWFKDILPELIASNSIKFTYTECEKMKEENEAVRFLLLLYKQLGALKASDGKSKREDVDIKLVEEQISKIQSHPEFIKHSCCDDPHIFAVVYSKPTKYIFSNDKRLAKCRDFMNKVIDSRYCDFIVISDVDVYKKHRAHIL